MKKKIEATVRIRNKKAGFQYNLLKKYTAGIMLRGTEVKAIRMSQVSINEAFCYFKKEELFVKNMNISEYSMGNLNNHQTHRERKLLLKKSELNQLFTKTAEKGYTIVPTQLFITDRGFVKLEIALAQGKKTFDKRNTIKDRDNKRDLDRLKKSYKLK